MFKTNYLLVLYLTLLTSVLYAQTEDDIKQKFKSVFSATKIEFMGSSMVLTQQSKITLLNTAKLIKDYPNYQYKITGYANSRQDEKFNKILSKNRALQVKNILIAQGIDKDIITAQGVVGLTPQKKIHKRKRIPISYIDFEIVEQLKKKPISPSLQTKSNQRKIVPKKQVEVTKKETRPKREVKTSDNKSLTDYLVLRKKESLAKQKAQKLKNQQQREKRNRHDKNDLKTQISKSRLSVFFSMNIVLFDENSILLTKKAKDVLYKTAEFMLYYPNFKFNITGHTDKSLQEVHDVSLSKKRAEVVKDYLVTIEKVNPSKLFIIGKGAEEPIANNSTKEEKALNRRVVFSIVE